MRKDYDLTFLSKFNVGLDAGAQLSEYTTLRLGGRCPYLIVCKSPSQLESVITELVKRGIKFLLIGSGSNILVSDDGISKVVVRYESKIPDIKQDGLALSVSGATLIDDLARYAAESGLEGLNYTTGIPGTIGGAIVGNAGAFGRQIGDVIRSVTLLNPRGEKGEVLCKDLGFRYRHSNLKDTRDIILTVSLELMKGDRKKLLEERKNILKERRQKHPDWNVIPTAGSFFKNIEPSSKAGTRQAAGWFLEQAGVKNLKFGGASVFPKHANIIIRNKNCSAQDVFELSKLMAKAVEEKFHLKLVREVRLAGDFIGLEKRGQSDFQ